MKKTESGVLSRHQDFYCGFQEHVERIMEHFRMFSPEAYCWYDLGWEWLNDNEVAIEFENPDGTRCVGVYADCCPFTEDGVDFGFDFCGACNDIVMHEDEEDYLSFDDLLMHVQRIIDGEVGAFTVYGENGAHLSGCFMNADEFRALTPEELLCRVPNYMNGEPVEIKDIRELHFYTWDPAKSASYKVQEQKY